MKRNPKKKTPRRDNSLALVLEQLMRDKRAEMPDPAVFNSSAFHDELARAAVTALGEPKARGIIGYLFLLE